MSPRVQPFILSCLCWVPSPFHSLWSLAIKIVALFAYCRPKLSNLAPLYLIPSLVYMSPGVSLFVIAISFLTYILSPLYISLSFIVYSVAPQCRPVLNIVVLSHIYCMPIPIILSYCIYRRPYTYWRPSSYITTPPYTMSPLSYITSPYTIGRPSSYISSPLIGHAYRL